jgi:hypothetical protein
MDASEDLNIRVGGTAKASAQFFNSLEKFKVIT